jgi:hypothetical protein
VIVVDDTLLLAVLAGSVPPGLQDASAARELATTGSWYWRLGRAVLDPTSAGTLSRAFADLSREGQERVEAGLQALPAEIGLVSLRRLVPVMTALDSGRRLNLLAAEAVASALLLDADIAVTTRSPLLEDACDRLGIQVHLIVIR